MDCSNIELYQKITAYVMGKVRDRQDAEDIVQNVFIKVLEKQNTLRDAEKITGWMYRLTHNLIMDYYRLRKKELAGFWQDTHEEQHVFNECVENCLTELSQTLPSPYKEALELSDKENLPQTELAQRWGISYSGAKSRVQRARQMLKEKIESLYHIKTDAYGNVIVCEDKVPCGCASYEVIQEMNR